MANVFGSIPRHTIHRPLMPMAMALMVGIVMGARWPGGFDYVLAAVAAVAVALCIRIQRKQWSICLPLIIFAGTGYLSIQPWLSADLPGNHAIRFVDQGYWRIQGVVADAPRVDSGRWRFELALQHLDNSDRSVNACGKIMVTGRREWPGASTGDQVEFRGRLRSIHGFSNPGAFDYERFMQLRGIRARVYASAHSLKIVSTHPSNNWRRWSEALRAKLSLQINTALRHHGDDSSRLLKALLLGARDEIHNALRADFNRAGTGHILAISGLHVGMVATVAYALARWILACIPLMLRRAWVRKGAALLSLGPVLGYGLLAGLAPSTQRAMLMVTTFLFSFWIGRRHDWLNTLALAAIIILAVSPPALMSISFQLSFAAVLAIIAGSNFKSGGKAAPQPSLWRKTGQHLMDLAWVSAMAILGTLPLVLHYFNQVSLVGLPTNLIVVPLVGMVVVPLGLLGCLAAAVSPALAAICWQAAAWGADLICLTVQYVASWPWAAIRSVTPNGLEITLYYLLGALGVFWKKLPFRAAVLAALLAVCVMDAGYWVYQRFGRSDLRATVLDVGQASANLLEFPGGYTVLVDGGGFSDNRLFDVGARIVAPLLWRKKIKTVDLVVLSHANSDHLNGLFAILKDFNVAEVWSNQEPARTKGYGHWIRLLAEQGVHQVDFEQLSRQVSRHGIQMGILAPPSDFMRRKALEPWRDVNNNSLVLHVDFGDVSFLFPGDIEHSAEYELVRRVGLGGLRSTILVVPHHGSKSSSSIEFLKAVMPEEAVISAGWQNRFGFPHADVTQRLAALGSRVWCTANSGAVEISTDGKIYNIRTFRPR